MLIVVLLIAIGLDKTFGEPKSLHPLVGFGHLANRLETTLNVGKNRLIKGLFASVLAILPILMAFKYLMMTLAHLDYTSLIVEAAVLYWAIGHRSLNEHVAAVKEALDKNDLVQARQKLAYIVSRDTAHLDHTQISQATIETTLENGSDSVFAPIFWFCVVGASGVIVYRLINTLDAMWGYRNERFELFGKVAALADDAMNYLPAKLVALTYSLVGETSLAFRCWKQHAKLLNSPNAGPVMTAGAGSLNLKLGGPAYYHGERQEKPYFGGNRLPNASDIDRALEIINATLIIWLALIFTQTQVTNRFILL